MALKISGRATGVRRAELFRSCTVVGSIGTQFIDALLMPAAVKFRAQEHLDAFFRHRFADHPSTDRQNIRVIMLAAQPRARDIMRKPATDMRMAVGGDRN